MKRTFWILLSALWILLLCACSSESKTPPAPLQDSGAESSTSISDTENVTVPLLLDDDEMEMMRILRAGKEFVACLQRGEEPANARDDGSDAVSAFRRFFRLDSLYVSGVFMNPNMPETYTCMISGLNDFNYARSVKVFYSHGEPMVWFCSIVYYYPYIDLVIDTYLGYLREKDAYGLAAWLWEGGPPSEKFIGETQSAIDYFNRYFDLSKTSIREAETQIVENYYSAEGFIFRIEDAKGVTFEVELSCGDGLCSPKLPY